MWKLLLAIVRLFVFADFRPIPQRKREIFRYWDGKNIRSCDPMQALIDMDRDSEFRADLHPKQVDQGDQEAGLLMGRMVTRVFNVSEYDPATGTGMTLAERLALYVAFMDFCELLKKSTSPWQTAPASTEPTAAASPDVTTQPLSASG